MRAREIDQLGPSAAKANDNGIVKLRGPKAGLGDPATFSTLVAKQVIDHGTESSPD